MVLRGCVLIALVGCTPAPAATDAGTGDGGGTVDAPDAMVGPRANLVFVTSTKQAPGSLGGLAGADAICRARATAAGLPGTFAAWLSTNTIAARDRLGNARGWRRVDGVPVVDTQGALIGGRIWHPILLDELGAPVTDANDAAVTNTAADGVPMTTASDCAGFTSTTGTTYAGAPAGTTDTWTEGIVQGTQSISCGTPMRLYCFGTDANVPVPQPAATGPRAFVTRTVWFPSGGVTGADAQCQQAASAFAIPGTFRALLSTMTASAASRFDLSRPPWVRLDGVRIAASRTAFMAGDLETSPGVYVDGTYNLNKGEAYIWTGGAGTAMSLPTDTGGSMTCMDWVQTSTNIYGGMGLVSFANRRFFDSGGNGGYLCHAAGGVNPPMLLCLEE